MKPSKNECRIYLPPKTKNDLAAIQTLQSPNPEESRIPLIDGIKGMKWQIGRPSHRFTARSASSQTVLEVLCDVHDDNYEGICNCLPYPVANLLREYESVTEGRY
jgi:hypothetical protein